jgi:hypothetical protein
MAGLQNEGFECKKKDSIVGFPIGDAFWQQVLSGATSPRVRGTRAALEPQRKGGLARQATFRTD